mgnify:CR=1 FL=1
MIYSDNYTNEEFIGFLGEECIVLQIIISLAEMIRQSCRDR